ncbi:alkaline phosphatase [Leucobacter chromiiresistens]|uniref:alkaline phosphatase n=1 Tax=Leucobacter chromiiresistens TaxID=1079994 RepID=UPI00073486BC|nr:alkaline phosphatase [Leucobacter chromiiresistens]
MVHLGKFARPVVVGGVALGIIATGAAFGSPAMAAETEAGVSPKNVIVLIGDGMGYNHIDFMNAETTGETHWQVERGGDRKVIPSGQNTTPTEGWQSWNHLGMSTHWVDGPVYDPAASWSDFAWNTVSPTDSAAAGTAMATGVKTYNAGLGVDENGTPVENVAERAKALGKSAGVVSSVPFSHATPAAYSSHNESRNNYHQIASEQIAGDLEVVIGAGHPFYTDDHQRTETGSFGYIAEDDWNAVSTGQTDRAFIETKADFEALAVGETPERVFGVAQVGSTLQQSRADGAPMNDVPDLATLSQGALNVLDDNENGFFLMVEGGAIDWAGHGNESERDLEEVADFDGAVASVIDWVETHSSWEDTLVVVTADHETGYLYGETPGDFSPIVPAGVEDPEALAAHSWNSGDHTNMLVPFFFKGAGTDQLAALGTKLDLVRGHYFDNTDMANWMLDTAWVAPEAPVDPPVEDATGAADGGGSAGSGADAGGAAGAGADGAAPGADAAAAGAGGAGADGAAPVAEAPAAAASPGGSAGGQGSLAATGAPGGVLPLVVGAGAVALAGSAVIVLRARRTTRAD